MYPQSFGLPTDIHIQHIPGEGLKVTSNTNLSFAEAANLLQQALMHATTCGGIAPETSDRATGCPQLSGRDWTHN